MPRSYVKEETGDGVTESKYKGRKVVRTNSRESWKEDEVCTGLMHCVKTRRKVNISLVLGHFYVQEYLCWDRLRCQELQVLVRNKI